MNPQSVDDTYHPNLAQHQGWIRVVQSASATPYRYQVNTSLVLIQTQYQPGAANPYQARPMMFPMQMISRHNTTSHPPIVPDFHSNQPLQLSIMSDIDAYGAFHRLILSKQEIVSNGFVHFDNFTGHIAVHEIRQDWRNWRAPEDPLRICVRCSEVFSLHYPEGNCRYHVQKRECCGQNTPCASASAHVHSTTNRNELTKFIRTPTHTEQVQGVSRNYKVFALDTEMIYTINGLEVARVTMVDTKGNTVVNVLVKPTGRIIDLNTQFSGIQDGYWVDALTLEEVRELLFRYINEHTILTGHHLSNDLKVLKIIHTNVVDTAVLFKRKNGSYQSLKDLAKKLLNKVIHQGNEGHDSAQDARTCIDLVARCWPQLVSNRQAV